MVLAVERDEHGLPRKRATNRHVDLSDFAALALDEVAVTNLRQRVEVLAYLGNETFEPRGLSQVPHSSPTLVHVDVRVL